MFNFIRNFFPLKAKSAEEFIDIVKRENCREIVVNPDRVNIGLGQYRYVVTFKATTPAGRDIHFNDACFEYDALYHWFFDAENQWKAAIQVYLLAEKKLEELKIRLSGVSAILARPGLGSPVHPMVKEIYDKLHSDAKACGVSV